MVFRKYIPGAPLDQYVDCMVYVEGNNKGVGFPKIAMSLVFNLHDHFSNCKMIASLPDILITKNIGLPVSKLNLLM